MTFADELHSRYKTKQREWEKYKEQVREAKEKEAQARAELSALEVLLASEKGKSGKSKERPVPITVPLPSEGAENKVLVVRQIIQQHGMQGLVPAQIRKLVEERKIEMPANYLYSILLRAKKREP